MSYNLSIFLPRQEEPSDDFCKKPALLNKHILCCTPGEMTDPRNAKSCS
ncbi:hypothetical protein [Symbiopectobacterium sp. RP]